MNSAPKLMSPIIKMILGKDDFVKKATSDDIDDILLDETTATAKEVISHPKKYGLTAKQPEPLEGGAVLRPRLMKDITGKLVFWRGNEIPYVND